MRNTKRSHDTRKILHQNASLGTEREMVPGLGSKLNDLVKTVNRVKFRPVNARLLGALLG